MVFQYTPVALIVAVATDASLAASTYCATSNSFHFAHLWVRFPTAGHKNLLTSTIVDHNQVCIRNICCNVCYYLYSAT